MYIRQWIWGGGGGGGWTAREVSVEADGTEPNLQIEN
jgi:hypothetical protein